MGDTLEIFGKEYTNVAGFKAKDSSGNTLTYIRGGGGGSDIPVFTLTWDSIQGEYSATCNKTFAECSDALYNVAYGALAKDLLGENIDLVNVVTDDNSSIWYACYKGDEIAYDIIYHSNGSIEVTTPSSLNLTLNATANGTYTPDDEGRFGVYTEVNVNVPSSGIDTSDATLTNGDQMLEDVTAYSNGVKYTGTIVECDSDDISLNYRPGNVRVSKGFYPQTYIKSIPTGTEGTPTATKGTVSNHSITITPSVTNTAGYIAGETKTGTAVTVSASELVSGSETKTANGIYDVTNLEELVVNVPTGTARSSSDLTVSGATVTVPAGLYSSQATKSVASGSAGTPTATKGTVSNHSITVTPSVTNTTGYITGGTKSGTGVTISASELVSGSQTITANGNNIDVTNLASVNVALTFSTIYTGTSTPSSSTGSNGDIYVKTAS